MSERQVVVNISCIIQHHSEDNVFAARFKQLGLTGYGDTEEEAVDNCKRLFNRFIRTYRATGKLAEVLNRATVEWHWRDEYPDDRPAFEDTNELINPPKVVEPDSAAFIDYPDDPARLPLYTLQLQAWTEVPPKDRRIAA